MTHSSMKQWVRDKCVPAIIEAYRNGDIDYDGIKDREKVTFKNVYGTVKKRTDITVNLKKRKTVQIYRYHETERLKSHSPDDRAPHTTTRREKYVLYRLHDNEILIAVMNGLQESRLKAKCFKNFRNYRDKNYGMISFDMEFNKSVLRKK